MSDEELGTLAERVQRGLKWLRAEGPAQGLSMQSLIDGIDGLNMADASRCAIGLAAHGDPHVYWRLDAEHDEQDGEGEDDWMAQHGFTLGWEESERLGAGPARLAGWRALGDEWKRAVTKTGDEASDD